MIPSILPSKRRLSLSFKTTVFLPSILSFISLLAISSLLTSTAQQIDEEDEFQCDSLHSQNYTCAACIQLHPSCAWCKKSGYDDNRVYSRCDRKERLLENGCAEADIMNPEKFTRADQDDPLTHTGEITGTDDAIQIKPQKIYMKLRPKESETVTLTYRQSLDYPVDLYYVMDMSRSMKDDKQKLTELGDLLAVRMKKITRNFQLGFGSFVDKKLVPFVDPRKEKRDNPCDDGCVPPYGFQHEMTLSSRTEKFRTQVNSTKISGNLDAPEGGLDALMQAMMCGKKIGWRERARRMIVYSSDAGFHYAGDGKLAGVIEPNDGQCHMEPMEGFGRNKYTYTKTLEQDYPSIAQIAETAKKTSSNIIFAVTKAQSSKYELLRDALGDVSASVGVLESDSRNIVELIESEYRKISQKITLTDDAKEELRLTYKSRCLNKDGKLNDTSSCDNIKVGDEVEFEVTVEALKCTENRNHIVQIRPSGVNEQLELEIDILCSCDCESEVQQNAEFCGYEGNLQCGVCSCNPGHIGRRCECKSSSGSTFELDNKCRRTNDSEICEGRGTCQCGRCSCNDRPGMEEITGRFCQCDNFNCPRHNRKICNDHGTCTCNKCECERGYGGRACECPETNDACISSNGLECNGRGKCICGVCSCDTDKEGIKYSGPTCEVCPTCPTKCEELRACVMCKAFGTGPHNETVCRDPKACPYEYVIVEKLYEIGNNSKLTNCQSVDPTDDCTFYYQYEEHPGSQNVTVYIKEEKDCPPPVPILAIILGVIAGIVLIGLLLLLVWKLLTILHDQREYAKFEKDRMMARWDTGENPIFTPATSTFKNPAYGGKQ